MTVNSFLTNFLIIFDSCSILIFITGITEEINIVNRKGVGVWDCANNYFLELHIND